MENEKKAEQEKKTKKTAPAKPRKRAPRKTVPKKRPDLEAHPIPENEEKAPPKQEEQPIEVPPAEKKEEKPIEYENEKIKIALFRKPGCHIEMQVKASQDIVKEAQKKAIRRVSKQVNFPGFRKGKAPDEMVLKNYPRDVDKNWQQIIADITFKEAQDLAKVALLDTNTQVQFKMQKHSLEGAELLLTFETTPEPPEIDPKQFEIKTIDQPTLDDKKIDEAIHQVRFYFAKWNTITDRPVKEGDYILLDLEDIETDPPKKVYTDTRFEVSDERMAKWMKDVVLGMKTGDSKEGVSQTDASASEEEKKEYKAKKVQITIKAIEEAELPPIDDTLAKNLGVSTPDEIRSSVEKLLKKQIDDHVKKQLREQANEFLLNKHPFELPPSLVEKEARFRLEQLGKDPNFIQFWQGRTEAERKNVINEIYDQAEKAMRMFYLCRKIVADAKLSVTADDIEKPATTPLEMLLHPSPESLSQQNTDIGHAETYSRLMMQKAEDYLIMHATKDRAATSKK